MTDLRHLAKIGKNLFADIFNLLLAFAIIAL